MGLPRLNSVFFGMNIFGGVTFQLLAPKDKWPDPPKKAKYHAASSLCIGQHFVWIQSPPEDLDKFHQFLEWLPTPKLKEYILEAEITRTLGEIYRSNRLVINKPLGLKKNSGVTESVVRLVVIDPFIKVILELTECEVDVEDPVGELPEAICDVSKKSVMDYAVYYLRLLKSTRTVILEAKTDESFSEKSVCQVVGYYMGTVFQGNLPPLGIAMTQSKLRFIFFPYSANNDTYSECFVSSPIEILSGDNFFSIVAFVVKYIMANETDDIPLIQETSLTLHSKWSYNVAPDKKAIESYTERELEAKEAEYQQKLQAKETELQAKETEHQQKLQAKETEHQQELQAKETEHQQKLQAEREKMASSLGVSVKKLHEMLGLPPPSKRTKDSAQ